jgi:hypothetical protein
MDSSNSTYFNDDDRGVVLQCNQCIENLSFTHKYSLMGIRKPCMDAELGCFPTVEVSSEIRVIIAARGVVGDVTKAPPWLE